MINGKEIIDLTDDDLLSIKLFAGHDAYIILLNKRNLRLRNKKIKNILNNQK